MSSPPPTRWSRAVAEPGGPGYADTFARLVDEGADVDGEARLADALVGRGARILDVGSGMGRVAAALTARGHEVVAVEPDPALRAQSEATYPGMEVLARDALEVTEALGVFDLVVCVGNVMVYLADGTERAVLAGLARRLAPHGRMLVGFHLRESPHGARAYAPPEFEADAAASGLVVQGRYGSYELHPPSEDYAVWLLARATRPDGSTR